MKTSSRLAALAQECSAASPDLPAEERTLLGTFVECVEDASDERYRLQFEDRELAQQLVGTYRFLRRRRRPEVRVRTATVVHRAARQDERNTLLEVLVSDQPFVVDTVRLFLDYAGLRLVSSLYLTLPVHRGRGGVLLDIDRRHQQETELLARFEIAGELQPEFLAHLEQAVRERLDVSRAVVRDFKRMKACLRAEARRYRRLGTEVSGARQEVVQDARALIDWLLTDSFILMGISFYPVQPSGDLGPAASDEELGAARLGEEEGGHRARMSHMLRGESEVEHWVLAYKSQEESLIHRAGKIDNFLLRSVDDEGRLRGIYHLRGLFTFKAIKTPGSQIPLLRLKLSRLVEGDGHRAGSLDGKATINAFDSIPVEFLFEAPPREIAAIVETILYVEKAKELRSHITVDREHRKALYFLGLPRHGYSEDLRRRIESVLIEGLGATYSDSRVYIGKFDTILLTFFFTAANAFKKFDRDELDDRVRSVAGTWQERLLRALVAAEGDERAHALWERYHRAFSDEYQVQHSLHEAVLDIQHLERLGDDPEAVDFEVVISARDRAQRRARLRLYQRRNVYLSHILPLLDNFGLQIVDQSHFRLQPTNGDELFIDSFRVAGVDGERHALVHSKEVVIEALLAVFGKRVANDALNRLTVQHGMAWRDVDVFRAMIGYLRQLAVGGTFQFMGNTLRQFPTITRMLLQLFQVRFDSALDLALEERQARSTALEEDVRQALHEVPSTAQDQLFRQLLNIVTSILRTNRYREPALPGEHFLSFKVDSRNLVMGGDPRLWREIYVHHFGMEGIHLRGGRLARGGIRWSDRPSDYRDEVLELMRTQMVKNVIIVPQGAKGGFIVRRLSDHPEQRRQQADAMYRIFIHGLLDVTDNVVAGHTLHPEGVICHDANDSYLVVAADKGTAHLSDTANAVATERGFWLGDAFASGGSHGYDHKALAITARGAWESVRRHLGELGIDPDRDSFTVAGIGDLSGDVFGNGMLLSRTMRLVAAFNHQHIFIDPDPQAERSFIERQRMFHLRRSTWSDYDPAAISEGGGVYARHAKTIPVSARARALLGITEELPTPEDVIRAILTLDVDVLWNGGIGTYIKASTEDDREVGDLANQRVRVNATKVRARVIAEGGNLGVTQAARIQYALRGGRLNTDFVDNSGGVDCSDHEVNLKILLQPEIDSGRMSLQERNDLLQRLAPKVCEQVLANNRGQGLLLSLDEHRSRHDLFSFDRTIKALEDRGLVVRERDRLPGLETLLGRQAEGRGMMRPELALVAAYTKMDVYKRLLKLPPQSIPNRREALRRYFPTELEERMGTRLDDHLLGRQIALTTITNEIIDHAGATFFYDVERETGASLDRIVTAYLAARSLAASRMRVGAVATSSTVAAHQQYEAIRQVEEAVRRAVAWLLSSADLGRLDRVTTQQAFFQTELARFEELLVSELTAQEQRRASQLLQRSEEAGFTPTVARAVLGMGYFTAGLTCVDIARRHECAMADVMSLYFRIGHLSHLIPFVRSWEDKTFQGRWDTLALRIIRNSVLESLGGLTAWLVGELCSGGGPEWVERGVELLGANPRVEELKRDLKRLTSGELSIASLLVAGENLRRFYAR